MDDNEGTVSRYTSRVEKLRAKLLPASSVLIATHDYPDPDCLASAWGLYHLFRFWGIENPVITFGGFVGRAENRSMIRLLGIRVKPLVVVTPSDFERIVLVDTFPGNGNLSLPSRTNFDAVLDHHPRSTTAEPPFLTDIREDLGATSTLTAQYLFAAGCPITPQLATALLYGIKADTHDMARNVSREDLDCFRRLFDLVDHRLLSRIEFPDRDAEYFRVLHRATEAMVVVDRLGYTHLGLVTTPDHIAEIADLFLSLENMEWMVASGVFEEQIFYSVRSKETETAGARAEAIARALKGTGGGHSTMAAGRIPLNGIQADHVRQKFLEALGKTFGVSPERQVALILQAKTRDA